MNDGGPAFPRPGITAEQTESQEGMTYRQWLIGKVLSGLCANPAVIAANGMNGWKLVNCTEKDLGAYAAYVADAAIVAQEQLLNETNNQKGN